MAVEIRQGARAGVADFPAVPKDFPWKPEDDSMKHLTWLAAALALTLAACGVPASDAPEEARTPPGTACSRPSPRSGATATSTTPTTSRPCGRASWGRTG